MHHLGKRLHGYSSDPVAASGRNICGLIRGLTGSQKVSGPLQHRTGCSAGAACRRLSRTQQVTQPSSSSLADGVHPFGNPATSGRSTGPWALRGRPFNRFALVEDEEVAGRRSQRDSAPSMRHTKSLSAEYHSPAGPAVSGRSLETGSACPGLCMKARSETPHVKSRGLANPTRLGEVGGQEVRI